MLSRQVKADALSALGRELHVSPRLIIGGIECDKANITIQEALGSPSEREQDLTWARAEVMRYGEDRVTFQVQPLATLALHQG
jgi:hypothetical protein